MTKKFNLMQLFSLVDGRMSTNMGDIYEMLNHICNDSLMTHHLPVALDYIKKNKPDWFYEVQRELTYRGITRSTDFAKAMMAIKADNPVYEIPQLITNNQERADFGNYMVENSLLMKKLEGNL